MSDHSSAAELKFRGHANDSMTVEFAVPGDWRPGLTIAFAKLMEKALEDGFPIVVQVRQDATAEQTSHVFAGSGRPSARRPAGRRPRPRLHKCSDRRRRVSRPAPSSR